MEWTALYAPDRDLWLYYRRLWRGSGSRKPLKTIHTQYKLEVCLGFAERKESVVLIPHCQRLQRVIRLCRAYICFKVSISSFPCEVPNSLDVPKSTDPAGFHSPQTSPRSPLCLKCHSRGKLPVPTYIPSSQAPSPLLPLNRTCPCNYNHVNSSTICHHG